MKVLEINMTKSKCQNEGNSRGVHRETRTYRDNKDKVKRIT